VTPLRFARKRLSVCLDEIARLKEIEFPYIHSRSALIELDQYFHSLRNQLSSLDEDADPGVISQNCAITLDALWAFLPILGFVLRSTNVRNAFEVYGPLLRLAQGLLEPKASPETRKTKLLLSSEWDYSPFLYRVPALPDFVLIGLPAPESANPLLVPLAGHELGHSVWQAQRRAAEFDTKVTQQLLSIIRGRWADYQAAYPMLKTIDELTTTVFGFQSWYQAKTWALEQTEESFCDFVGLRLFGDSYLHAFAYLLAPRDSSARPPIYPNNVTRARHLSRAADVFKVQSYEKDGRPAYETLFEDRPEPSLAEADRLQLSLADQTLEELIEDLIIRADQAVTSSEVSLPSEEETARVYGRFEHLVPCENVKTLADIISAAWRAYEKPDLWIGAAQPSLNKDVVLRELVLKNVEVFEIEQILKETP
jgi:hypothetical protein